MAPYHVLRSQQFVRERFGNVAVHDAKTICANIANTQFPVPEGKVTDTRSDPALVRSADLIGQLADTGYLVKLGGAVSRPCGNWRHQGPRLQPARRPA
jgi:hypothetical protein